MLKTTKYFRISVLVLVFLTLLVLLPFLAPVLSYYGYKQFSNFIYEIYSFTCHQKAHRSMFLFDEQCAWCFRDTFIWGGIWICALLIFKNNYRKPISLKGAAILCVPMIIDGFIQLIATLVSLRTQSTPFYESTNLLRALTGSLFGIGISFFIFPKINQEVGNFNRNLIK